MNAMQAVVHQERDLHAFYQQVSAYLMAHELEHNMMLGLLHSWIQTAMPSLPVYMAYAETNGHISAVVMRIEGYRALCAAMTDAAGVEALVDHLYAQSPDMSGVVAQKAEAAVFARHWQAVSGREAHLNRAERLFRLDKVEPTRPAQGQYRAAMRDDVQLLADWILAFEMEADPSAKPDDRERYIDAVTFRMNSPLKVRGLRVWEHNGQVVSMAGYAGPTPNSIRIGPVYTPPYERGHGYATAVTATLTQELLDMGFPCVTLYTDLANPTSNSIYQKIGYRPVCDVDEYLFRDSNHA